MNTPQKNIIQIDNYDKLGSFYANYGEVKPIQGILKPCFQISSEKKMEHLKPGYLTSNGFIECPLAIFYIELFSVKVIRIDYPIGMVKVELEFSIYNKSYKNFIRVKITDESHGNNFMIMNTAINTLNRFVDSNNDIGTLNLNSREIFHPHNIKKDHLINLVNELKMEFYENSLNRIGRDDSFWDECEIRNLPKQRYLKTIFINCLKKLCKRIEITDYGLKMVSLNSVSNIGIDLNYNSSFGRRKLHSELYIELYQKALLMDLAIIYNNEEYLFDRLKNVVL